MRNLKTIKVDLRLQNNRCTADPVFVVQRQVQDIVPQGYHDSHEWCETKSGECGRATELQSERLDLLKAGYRDTGKWECFYFRYRWEFVTACFTENGCKAYLRINGHNLGKTQIYAESAYRNMEWIHLRELMLRGSWLNRLMCKLRFHKFIEFWNHKLCQYCRQYYRKDEK